MAGAKIDRLGPDDPAALGPYELIGRLGSGGMGRVYLARSGTRIAAVKTLLTQGAPAETDRRRFAREVALAQRVAAGHTARVLDADPGAERPWMATEYIAAPPLSELRSSAGAPPASTVRWIGAGVAAALVALHRAGIVHRDIKPQNVLLPLDGPRVIDFGISHAADLTRTSLTLGTVAFTSPEQARGEPSTQASDVYSLGATLFHLAVGRPPYVDDGDTLRLLARVARGEVDLTGLPKELGALILPCLAAEPRERPQPADVLAQFVRGLADLPASPGGDRWLPPRWSSLIKEYESQFRALRREPEAPAIAPPAPPPPPAPEPELEPTRAPEPLKAHSAPAPDAPTKTGQRNPVGYILLLAALVATLIQWHPWSRYDGTPSSTPSSPAASTTPPTGDDLAFRAVKKGDCLSTYADGKGGWTDPLPVTVGCDAATGYLGVAALSGDNSLPCPTGTGYNTWSHVGADGRTSTLCLRRNYRKGECFPVQLRTDGKVAAYDLFALRDCGAATLPDPYNRTMKITDYRKAPASYTGAFCPSEPGVTWYYWTVEDARNVVCALPVTP
ncbi:serine/threonine-protein kinase [Streptomyces violascens]|uniref:serine/threonine-protein kinase n=1 Tax=Streptomyces violascens TaxID=67381 RepID=UPI00365E4D69